MQKVLLVLALLMSFACNTSKQQIQDAAIIASKSAVQATSDQEAIISNTEKLEDAALVLDKALEEIDRARVTLIALEPILRKITAASNPKVASEAQMALELVGSAKNRVSVAVPVIKETTKSIRKSAESTKRVVKDVIKATDTILDKGIGVENSQNEWWRPIQGLFSSAFGWLGGTLSSIIMVLVVIFLLINFPTILSLLKFRTGIGIPKRHTDLAALLEEALRKPNRNNVENLAVRWRADRKHDVAYERVQLMKRKKLTREQAKEFDPVMDSFSDMEEEGSSNTS